MIRDFHFLSAVSIIPPASMFLALRTLSLFILFLMDHGPSSINCLKLYLIVDYTSRELQDPSIEIPVLNVSYFYQKFFIISFMLIYFPETAIRKNVLAQPNIILILPLSTIRLVIKISLHLLQDITSSFSPLRSC